MNSYTVKLTPNLINLSSEGSLDTSIFNGLSLQRTVNGIMMIGFGGNRKIIGRLKDGDVFDNYIEGIINGTIPGAPSDPGASAVYGCESPEGCYTIIGWTVPEDNGGLEITEYRIYSNNSFVQAVPGVSGLVQLGSQIYPAIWENVEISAVNEAGEGPRGSIYVFPY